MYKPCIYTYRHAKMQVFPVEHGLQCRISQSQLACNAKVPVPFQCFLNLQAIHCNSASSRTVSRHTKRSSATGAAALMLSMTMAPRKLYRLTWRNADIKASLLIPVYATCTCPLLVNIRSSSSHNTTYSAKKCWNKHKHTILIGSSFMFIDCTVVNNITKQNNTTLAFN